MKLKETIAAVATFHDAFGIENNYAPTANLSEADIELRFNLMKEENEEYLEAAKNNDIVEIADALGDQLYILCGTILRHGLQDKIIEVFEEIVAIREVCGDRAHLKVILETGELVTLDNVRKASYLAMLAGADFIKTSTGKVAPAATAPVVLVMLEAVRDFYDLTKVRIGVKPAGGIRTTKDAIKQLVLVNETAGPEWLNPSLFRIGASALLNDLLMQRMKMSDGYYASPNYVTID